MKGTLVTIAVNGTMTRTQTCKSGEDLLPMLRAAVSGDIETVPHWMQWTDPETRTTHQVVAFCNQDGKRDQFPNWAATAAWVQSAGRRASDLRDALHGPVVIVFGDQAFMDAL